MSAMQQPRKDVLRDQLALAADEIIRRGELLADLSESGHWLTNSAGLLGLGFVAGVVAGSVLVGAVAVLT